MKSSGLFRLGRDAETRTIPSGESVVELALAYNYGKKGQDGNRPSQWIKASFWGARAAAVAPYLLKGGQVVAHLSDLHIESFEGKNGPGTNLVGRVDDVELVASGQTQQQRPAQQPARQAPPPKPTYQPPPQSAFDVDDSDVPF